MRKNRSVQTIKKVLNSSVVLVEDEHGVESIVLGKGIGYGQKAGSEVLPDPTFQVFRASSDKEQQLLVELLKQIPAEFVDLTREIVDRAESAGLEIDSRIYLSLTDHLNFATERAKSNLNVVNRLAWEMRTLYPRQYEVAEYGVRRLRELTGASIPRRGGRQHQLPPRERGVEGRAVRRDAGCDTRQLSCADRHPLVI